MAGTHTSLPRLRRNALIHRSGKPTAKLLDIIDRGDKLNAHSVSKGAIKNDFDFTTADLTHLSWREILDILRIVRVHPQLLIPRIPRK